MVATILALGLTFAPQTPLTAEEARDFMKRLATFVRDHHLKKDEASEQRGMVYEYFDVSRQGQIDQWVQGEALDTMHDGAWLAVALVNATRATGDPEYRDLLTRWILPFYCKILNRSDTLFHSTQEDVTEKGVRFGLEHRYQEGEKGFVPYWWDDAASVSLERCRSKDSRTFYLASSEEQVRVALLRELGEGPRTWRTVLDEKGYIPTGDGPGWYRLSDAGGYAHLLSAASQWLLVLDGKRDWDVHRFPRSE